MDALNEMEAIGKSVAFEERSADLGEAKPDETLGEKGQFFRGATSLGSRLKGPGEELNERSETELVHVVHFDEITENHEKVRASEGEITVDIPLLV
jgi:hypothetical protein